MTTPKTDVRDFWDAASCGEVYASGNGLGAQFEAQRLSRYQLEPYIRSFAAFEDGFDRDVLEVGVGMGADHIEWVESRPRTLAGIDLTPRSISWTAARLKLYGHPIRLSVGDAESLPYPDQTFDLVYSWGVLHHTPDTQAAFNEVHRVLRPGGTARIMIYHRRSIVGVLLWIRFGLLSGRPRRSLDDIYSKHLESPGTKAFSAAEGERLASRFSRVRVQPQLALGDLLEGAVGQQYESGMLRVAKRLWPRSLIRRLLPGWGLALLIEARK